MKLAESIKMLDTYKKDFTSYIKCRRVVQITSKVVTTLIMILSISIALINSFAMAIIILPITIIINKVSAYMVIQNIDKNINSTICEMQKLIDKINS